MRERRPVVLPAEIDIGQQHDWHKIDTPAKKCNLTSMSACAALEDVAHWQYNANREKDAVHKQ